jgi:hypothetical protein
MPKIYTSSYADQPFVGFYEDSSLSSSNFEDSSCSFMSRKGRRVTDEDENEDIIMRQEELHDMRVEEIEETSKIEDETHKILTLPEILDKILPYLKGNDILNLSKVCKTTLKTVFEDKFVKKIKGDFIEEDTRNHCNKLAMATILAEPRMSSSVMNRSAKRTRIYTQILIEINTCLKDIVNAFNEKFNLIYASDMKEILDQHFDFRRIDFDFEDEVDGNLFSVHLLGKSPFFDRLSEKYQVIIAFGEHQCEYEFRIFIDYDLVQTRFKYTSEKPFYNYSWGEIE